MELRRSQIKRGQQLKRGFVKLELRVLALLIEINGARPEYLDRRIQLLKELGGGQK